MNNRFFNKDLAGGALLDIGVYAAAFARSFLSERPEEVLTTVKYFETGVDEQSGIILKNSRDEMAVMALTMRAKQPKRGVVAGEKGYIEVNNGPSSFTRRIAGRRSWCAARWAGLSATRWKTWRPR